MPVVYGAVTFVMGLLVQFSTRRADVSVFTHRG